jgi:hypothetical protein
VLAEASTRSRSPPRSRNARGWRSTSCKPASTCFVETPLAQSVADAEAPMEAARAADRVLMVGHLLEYHSAFPSARNFPRF